MVDPIDNVVGQAQQGSVAAIIQLLNEKLTDSGVRTRAVFADGVLQLLCEAAQVEQLEQKYLVRRIRQILESIAPRNVRRVNINSRIVDEQQLLWLEEITHDRTTLLWSEEIILSQPSFFQQLQRDLIRRKTEKNKPTFPKTASSRHPNIRKQNLRSPAVLGKAGLGLVALLVLWGGYSWFSGKNLSQQIPAQTTNSVISAPATSPNSPASPATSKTVYTPASDDPFAAAVRIANQASTMGQTATTSTQWLDLAAKWQRAADLMSEVPQNHNRYQEAQIRTKLYKKYSEAAQRQAQSKSS